MIKRSLITIATLGLMVVSASAVDTKACVGCHGNDFEKKAMNVSKIVKDMGKEDIVVALKGYKEDKGGAMKAVMKGQVAKLSDADIDAIATQIVGGEKKDAKATEAKVEKKDAKATEAKVEKKDAKATEAKVEKKDAKAAEAKVEKKVEDNATKAEDNATKAEDNATKAEDNATKTADVKVENNSTKKADAK